MLSIFIVGFPINIIMASGENSTQEKLDSLPAKIIIDKNLAKQLAINSEEDNCSIR